MYERLQVTISRAKSWMLNELKEPLIRESTECEIHVAFQHKSKVHIYMYKELKQEVGCEDYLHYVKGVPSSLFAKFCSGTHGLFDELGRLANRGGSQQCPNCGAYKELVEHFLFARTSYDSQRKFSWTT